MNPFFAELVARIGLPAESDSYQIAAARTRKTSAVENRKIDELTGADATEFPLIPAVGSESGATTHQYGTPSVVPDRTFPDVGSDEIGVNDAGATAGVIRQSAAIERDRILIAHPSECAGNVAERLPGAGNAGAVSSGELPADIRSTCGNVANARTVNPMGCHARPEPSTVPSLFRIGKLDSFRLPGERGFAVGPDMAPIGFDDSAWIFRVHPQIAAIDQPLGEIACKAWMGLKTGNQDQDKSTGNTRIACRPAPRMTLVVAPEGTGIPRYGRAAA